MKVAPSAIVTHSVSGKQTGLQRPHFIAGTKSQTSSLTPGPPVSTMHLAEVCQRITAVVQKFPDEWRLWGFESCVSRIAASNMNFATPTVRLNSSQHAGSGRLLLSKMLQRRRCNQIAQTVGVDTHTLAFDPCPDRRHGWFIKQCAGELHF